MKAERLALRLTLGNEPAVLLILILRLFPLVSLHLRLGALLVVHLRDHRQREVEEEESTSEHEKEKVHHGPARHGVHGHVH